MTRIGLLLRYVVLCLDCGQIDRYGVDTEKAVDKISRQLLEHNVITEAYGGQVPIVPVRKKKDGCFRMAC